MSEADVRPTKVAFLLMPFQDGLNWLRDEIVLAAADAGIAVERADDISSPGVIVDQVVDSIEQADLVIAVLTGHNPNVFFELGIAWRWHEPVLVADTAEGLPFDIRHRRVVLYGSEGSNERLRFGPELRRTFEAVAASEVLPRGRRIGGSQRRVAQLDLKVLEGSGKHSNKLEVVNRGTVSMHEITIDFPKESGWHLSIDTFGSYPIRELKPGDAKRALLSPPGLGHSPVAQATVKATTDRGDPYEDHIEVSVL